MNILAEYWKKIWKCAFLAAVLFLSFNLYFICLMRDKHGVYLIYLDILLLIPLLIWLGIDYGRFYRFQKEKESRMAVEDVIYQMFSEFENRDIAEHDVQVLTRQIEDQFQTGCDLQDYVAKWCHEMKIPLAAALLLNEKREDRESKLAMQTQLEKMNQQVQSLLLGCRTQSAVFDLQIREVSLAECVRTSIRNNQFFLMQKGFSIDVEVGEEKVYADKEWLVYILDQLLQNAVKYAKETDGERREGRHEEPYLHIWTEDKCLFVEDRGEGIRDCDIRRIFEKGFTGSNHHNGKYKSTGMGLYLAARIARKLGYEISVESEYGRYARFCIRL